MGKKKIRILVVDDNALNREMMARRLEFHKFGVFLAENGKDAIGIVKNERPDLVLMDLTMGVMDGLEATRLMKGSSKIKKIPIIAVSGHVLYGDRDKAMAAGCDEFEPKPIDFDRLLKKILALV